jgi:hypothetical protein
LSFVRRQNHIESYNLIRRTSSPSKKRDWFRQKRILAIPFCSLLTYYVGIHLPWAQDP